MDSCFGPIKLYQRGIASKQAQVPTEDKWK